jgi:tetratricopeptide (TPR) repeat protein
MKEKSLDYMNESLKKDKNNVEVLSNGVFILLTMGENDKAEAYLAELNRIAPNKPKVQQRAGMVAEQAGKLNIALTQYEKSFNGDPTDLATIQMLGNILLKQESWLKAINHYRKALESHPNEPYLLEKLGSLLITCPDSTLRKIDEGMEYAERALDHKSSSMEVVIKAGSVLSEAYAAKGDKQTAITYLNSVIDLAQNNNAPKEYLVDLGRKLKQLSQ